MENLWLLGNMTTNKEKPCSVTLINASYCEEGNNKKDSERDSPKNLMPLGTH